MLPNTLLVLLVLEVVQEYVGGRRFHANLLLRTQELLPTLLQGHHYVLLGLFAFLGWWGLWYHTSRQHNQVLGLIHLKELLALTGGRLFDEVYLEGELVLVLRLRESAEEVKLLGLDFIFFEKGFLIW
jgi:hypothetical protein